MTPIFVLFRKSVRIFLRNKAALVLTFVVPIVLIYIFGHVFGLYPKDKKGSGPSGITVAVVDQSGLPAAQALIDALKKETAFRIITVTNGPGAKPITEDEARRAILNNEYRFALILPQDMFPTDRVGVKFKFLSDPRNEIEAQMVNGLLQKNIFTQVPQLLGEAVVRRAENSIGRERLDRFNHAIADLVAGSFGADPQQVYRTVSLQDFRYGTNTEAGPPKPVDPTLRRLDDAGKAAPAPANTPATDNRPGSDVLAQMIQIESEQLVGKTVSNPAASRTVGGYAIMFLLFALSGSATSLFEEKQMGIFQRILAAPVRPMQILWARFLFGVALGFVQLATLFVAGKFLFGLDLQNHLPALIVLTLSAAAACTAFGMLVAAITPTQEAASGLATLLVLTMTAIGGAWFPISMMPDFIQKLSRLSLVYWAVEGYSAILWAGKPLAGILLQVGVLSAIAIGVMLLATWLFQRNKMFE